ncbi:ABC transporter ATP-binding protein [Tistrella bauzanensis]|uniref:ABC transporter ATP-binding protein n=1 Tax=Tistrella bauzanensis TaxID=657419 RepID=A0ABQ1IP70_9PROT|nr:ATP-binding cassette domain-containing protein [Tistrella bauzanensis]GGB47278.1 ABC transporter ATP-binding protein [Tistrella bauzanensis]
MLEIERVRTSIASVEVLRDFTLSVGQGQMVGLVGRNGAGKTSLMRTVMGHLPTTSGRISFDGTDLAGLPKHGRAALGIGFMQEDRGLVPELTVQENILLPVWVSKSLKPRARLDLVYGYMPELLEMRDRRALLLSGGQQKLVALARALAVGTRLLLLDEPFEGVAPALAQRLADVIGRLRAEHLSILVSHSDMNHAQSLYDDAYVIERGANAAAAAH